MLPETELSWEDMEQKIPSMQSEISGVDSAIQKLQDPEFINLEVGDFFKNIKTHIPAGGFNFRTPPSL